MALDYTTVYNAYLALYPDAQAKLSAPGGGSDEFNAWWGDLEQKGINNETLGALTRLLTNKPDQRAEFLKQGGDVQGYLNWMADFWAGEGGHAASGNLGQFKDEMDVLDAYGYEVNPDVGNPNVPGGQVLDPNGNIPYEQVLGEEVVARNTEDIARDAERRTQAGGIVTDINRSIDDALAANRQITEGRLNTDLYLQQNPDVAAWAAEAVRSGAYPDVATAAKVHYNQFGRNEGRSATLVTRLQDEYAQTEKTVAETAAAAEKAAASRLAALEQRKVEMTTALERTASDRSGALDKETASLREGLTQLETERRGALEELRGARIAAANAEVTGINQALQGERDRITARTAQQGFIGGSTMEDVALARAAIGARQGAAQTMGGARVANATDSRDLGNLIADTRFNITGRAASEGRGITDELARGRFSLSDALSQGGVNIANQRAGDIQGAENFGIASRGAYFDNDFNRRQGAAPAAIALNTARLNFLNTADEAGEAGLNRSLNRLNWFNTGATPPPSSTPTLTTPGTTGADLAGFGANLAGAGFSIGNTVGWGGVVNPRTGGGTTTTPAATTDMYGFPIR